MLPIRRSRTYQDTAKLATRVRGYIDSLAGFRGRTWRGVTVRGADISSRSLEIAIPRGAVTPAQAAVFREMAEYARRAGVTLKVIEF